MAIMLELQRNRLKLSHISRKLNLTLTEASRHLQRLSEDSLIEKDSNGRYGLTPFGTLALSLLSGLSFASKNRKYFLEYDLSIIPYEFIGRIGELAEGKHQPDTIKNIEETEKRIREAQQLIWILSDQILTSSIQPLDEKLKGPFDLRIVLPETMFPPENKFNNPSTKAGVQARALQKIDVMIMVTEKYAVICLPNRNGRKDYTGFNGTDPKFLKWCRDLFLHYWEQAKTFGPTRALATQKTIQA